MNVFTVFLVSAMFFFQKYSNILQTPNYWTIVVKFLPQGPLIVNKVVSAKINHNLVLYEHFKPLSALEFNEADLSDKTNWGFTNQFRWLFLINALFGLEGSFDSYSMFLSYH